MAGILGWHFLGRVAVFAATPWVIFAVCYLLVRGWSGLIATWVLFPFFFYCDGYSSPLLMLVHSMLLAALTGVLASGRSWTRAWLSYLALVALSVLAWRTALALLDVPECVSLP